MPRLRQRSRSTDRAKEIAVAWTASLGRGRPEVSKIAHKPPKESNDRTDLIQVILVFIGGQRRIGGFHG
jgi:hypothetical protein